MGEKSTQNKSRLAKARNFISLKLRDFAIEKATRKYPSRDQVGPQMMLF